MDDKTRTKYFIQRVVKIFLFIMLLLVFLAPIAWILGSRAEARHVLSKAKSVKMAMGMLSLEYYSTDKPLFDSNGKFGFADNALDDVLGTAVVDGEVKLISWDSGTNTVREFTYREGHYTVTYTYDASTKESSWDVDYTFEILSYKSYS